MQTLTPNLKVIMVSFKPEELSRFYAYYTHIDLEPGDHVVVKVAGKLKVVQVMETEGLSANDISKAAKCIVQKVDLDGYSERIEQLKTIRELKNKLRQRKEQLDEMIIYQQLAESDPTMKELVDQMNTLAPGAIPTLTDGDK